MSVSFPSFTCWVTRSTSQSGCNLNDIGWVCGSKCREKNVRHRGWVIVSWKPASTSGCKKFCQKYPAASAESWRRTIGSEMGGIRGKLGGSLYFSSQITINKEVCKLPKNHKRYTGVQPWRSTGCGLRVIQARCICVWSERSYRKQLPVIWNNFLVNLFGKIGYARILWEFRLLQS